MLTHLRQITSLLLGFGVLQIGHGLLGSLLGVRASISGFSGLEIGWVMSGYFIGFIAGSRGAPALVRRAGHVRTFAALASGASATVLAHGLWVEPWAWFVLRVVHGFCMVGMFIVVESWLNQQVDQRRRGAVFSVYLTTNLLAIALGQWLLLISSEQPLLHFGLVSLLMSIGLIPIALTRQREPAAPKRITRMGVRKLFQTSPFGTAGTVASGFIVGSFNSLGPYYILSRGLGNAEVASFMSTVMLGGALSLMVIGRLSDSLDRRKVLVGLLALTAVTPLGMLSVDFSAPISLVALLAFGVSALNIYSISATHLHDHLTPRQSLGATSTLQAVYGISAIIGPLTTGILMQVWHLDAFVWMMMAAALVVTGLGIHRLRQAPPIGPESRGDHLPGRSPSVIITRAVRSPSEPGVLQESSQSTDPNFRQARPTPDPD